MTKRFVDKYRPKRLRSVAGQKGAVATIDGLLRDDKIRGNTLLLHGPYGSGKTTMARIIARSVNCLDTETRDACGKCKSCKIPIGRHADIQEINAAEARGIDDARRIMDLSKMRPRFNTRVFILDELHQLTQQAAQSFLKDLEEPPPHVTYILCTTEFYKLPATIRSRATKIQLGLVRDAEMVRHLGRVAKKEGREFDKEVLQYLVEHAGGHVRDALTLLETLISSSAETSAEAKEAIPELAAQILGADPRVMVPKYVQRLLGGDISALVALRKVENQEHFLKMVISFLKDYTIFKINPKMIDDKAIASFHKQAKLKIEGDKIIPVIEYHMEALANIRRGLDPIDSADLAVFKSSQSLRA